MDHNTIPKPFTEKQTELFENRTAIVAAIKRLGIEARYAAGANGSLHDRFWKEIEQSEHPEDFELYLKEFPEGVHSAFARLKIARLRRILPAASKKGGSEPAHNDSSSNRTPLVALIGCFILALILASFVGNYFWQSAQLVLLRSALAKQFEQQAQNLADIVTKANEIVTAVQRQNALDDAQWKIAESTNLISGWKGYIARRPAGLHSEEAEAQIQSRLNNGRTIAVLKGHDDFIAELEFVKGNFDLISRTESGQVFTWNIATKEVKSRSKGKKLERRSPVGSISTEEVRPDMSINFKDGQFRISSGYSLLFSAKGPSVLIDRGDYSNRGRLSATPIDARFTFVRYGARTYLLDHMRGRSLQLSLSDGSSNSSIAINLPISVAIDKSESRLVFSAGRHMRLFRISDLSKQVVLDGHTSNILAIAFSENGLIAASGGEDETVRIWDLSDL